MRTQRTIVVFSLLVAACSGSAASDVTDFEDAPMRVEVDIAAGDVTITGNATTDGASVEATVDGEATPSIELIDGVLAISDDCATDCSVDYSILVAEDADVIVTTDDGNVTLTNISGTVRIDTPAGSVTLGTVGGDIQVIVGDGDVLGTRLESAVATFEATTGDIDVTFDEVVGTLIVATDEGDVTVQLPDAPYDFETSPSDAEIRLDETAGADNTVSLTTGDGEIIVYKR